MSQRKIESRGYGGRFTNVGGQAGYEYYDKYGNLYASLKDAKEGYENLHAIEQQNAREGDPFYQELSTLLGMSVEDVHSFIGKLGGSGNLNKKDLLNMIMQQKIAERSFNLSNGDARYSQLLAMGMSRQAALQFLSGGSVSSAPLAADFAALDQQQEIAQQQNMIAAQDATTNRQNATTAAYNAYMQNYETRFLQEGRDLLSPIAGAVYGWILDHEGDPNYFVPDWAKRSPEKFKRWMLETDADGNYLRPDAEQLIKSDAWDKMSHSLAGVSAFRKEFADNIAGRAPHEMEFDAQHRRIQLQAQSLSMQCANVVAQRDAFQAGVDQWVQEFNSGLSLDVSEDGSSVSIRAANEESPWYGIFYAEDGSLREDLPILLSGLSADLQTRMQDCLEYDGYNELKWQQLRSDAELQSNYACLYALMYGDMRDTYDKLREANPQVAGELFKTQMLYQQVFGNMANQDQFSSAMTLHINRMNAETNALNAETNVYNAETQRVLGEYNAETQRNATNAEVVHKSVTDQVSIYNAVTQRLSGKYGTHAYPISDASYIESAESAPSFSPQKSYKVDRNGVTWQTSKGQK